MASLARKFTNTVIESCCIWLNKNYGSNEIKELLKNEFGINTNLSNHSWVKGKKKDTVETASGI